MTHSIGKGVDRSHKYLNEENYKNQNTEKRNWFQVTCSINSVFFAANSVSLLNQILPQSNDTLSTTSNIQEFSNYPTLKITEQVHHYRLIGLNYPSISPHNGCSSASRRAFVLSNVLIDRSSAPKPWRVKRGQPRPTNESFLKEYFFLHGRTALFPKNIVLQRLLTTTKFSKTRGQPTQPTLPVPTPK